MPTIGEDPSGLHWVVPPWNEQEFQARIGRDKSKPGSGEQTYWQRQVDESKNRSAKIDKSFAANMVDDLIAAAIKGHSGLDLKRTASLSRITMILAYIPWPPPGIFITFDAKAEVGVGVVKKNGGISLQFSVSADLKFDANYKIGIGMTLKDTANQAGIDNADYDIRKKTGVSAQMFTKLKKDLLSKNISTSEETLPAKPDAITGSLTANAKIRFAYFFAETSAGVDVFRWEFGKDAEFFVGGKITTKFGLTGVGVGVTISGGGHLESTLTV
jgi:hypothetical protein